MSRFDPYVGGNSGLDLHDEEGLDSDLFSREPKVEERLPTPDDNCLRIVQGLQLFGAEISYGPAEYNPKYVTT